MAVKKGRGMRALSSALGAMALVALGGAPAASAAPLVGNGSDPVDPAIAGGRDVVALAVQYDAATGEAGAGLTFREPPSAAADGFAIAYFGRQGAGGCMPELGLGGYLDSIGQSGAWVIVERQSTTASGAAVTRGEGNVFAVAAQDAAIANRGYDCAYAVVTARDSGSVVYDEVEQRLPLVAAPPPIPTPPTPPAPQPPAPQPPTNPAPAPAPAPAPTPSGTPAARGTPTARPRARPAARLALVAPASTATVARNRWVPQRIRVVNRGTRPAGGVTVRLTAPRGVTVTPRAFTVRRLAPGAGRRVTVRVRAGRGARTGAAIKLVARARGVRAAARASLALRLRGARRPAPRRRQQTPARRRGATRRAAPAPTPAAPPLARRYYTHVKVDTMSWNRWTGLIFLDDRWAYRGIPETGGLPACTSRTVGVDEDGDPTPGCVPYTYDASSNALTIDGQPASIDRDLGAIRLGEDDYSHAPLVRAGTRFAADLKVVNISGFWPNQTVNQKFFTFFADGNFTVSSETFGSFGGMPGTPGSGNFAVVPPDSKGAYAFAADGSLRLDYADGRSTVKLAGILPFEGDGSTDPTVAGFLWGEEQFYKPDE